MSLRPQLSESLIKRLRKVRMLVLDVDGVLTDCRVFRSDDGEWRRVFSIRDGYGIVRLHQEGYKTAIITGSKSADIRERAKILGIQHFYEGSLEKMPNFQMLQKESGLLPDQMAYMGDDVFDVPLLEQVSFAATVTDAMEEAIEASQYKARRPAGNGAVREVCELILRYGAFSKQSQEMVMG